MQTTNNQGGVMAPPKHNIFIIEAAGEYRVRPAVAVVEVPPYKLKIRNMTQYTAVLVFPNDFLLAGTNPIQYITSGEKLELDLTNFTADKPVRFQYSVVISKEGEVVPATGESAPSVIVDP
jgi:hypothetical protein